MIEFLDLASASRHTRAKTLDSPSTMNATAVASVTTGLLSWFGLETCHSLVCSLSFVLGCPEGCDPQCCTVAAGDNLNVDDYHYGGMSSYEVRPGIYSWNGDGRRSGVYTSDYTDGYHEISRTMLIDGILYFATVLVMTLYLVAVACSGVGRDDVRAIGDVFREPKRRDELRKLPTVLWQAKGEAALDAAERGEAPECALCLEPIADGQTVLPLRCSHIYHESCIRQWFDATAFRRRSCPECRANPLEEEEEPRETRPGCPARPGPPMSCRGPGSPVAPPGPATVELPTSPLPVHPPSTDTAQHRDSRDLGQPGGLLASFRRWWLPEVSAPSTGPDLAARVLARAGLARTGAIGMV